MEGSEGTVGISRGERERQRERKKKAKQTEAAARSTELQNWLLQEAAQVRGGGFRGGVRECTGPSERAPT